MEILLQSEITAMKNRILLFLFLSFPVCLLAQKSSITGKIVDESTGEDLVGAVVQIEALGLGAASDLFGTYTIQNVPAGTHELTVSYISYQTKKITDVIVAEGKATTLDIALGNAPIETGIVNVVDFKKTNTEASVLMEMKDAKGVLSGMSGKQIAKTPDPDAAAVAKRIPGVTIIDNRFVMVRGLQERYNAVTLNGALAPSLETDVKSFSFDLIPAGLIDRLLIYKSPSPDIQGEFAGGAIDVITKNFPDENFEVKVSYLSGIRQGTTGELFRTNNVTDKDWLANGASSRSLPSEFPQNLRTVASSEIEAIGKKLPNTWGYENSTAPIDHRLSASVGKQFNLKKGKLGSITAINYSRSFQFTGSNIGNYNVYDFINNEPDTTEYYTDSIYAATHKVGLMQNFGFKNEHHEISWKNFYNQTGMAENTFRTDTDIQNGILRKSYQFRYMDRALYSGQLTGKHKIMNETGEVTWVIGYNKTNRDEPDMRRMIYQQPLEDLSIPYQAVVAPSAQPFYMGRLFMELEETSLIQSASYQHYFNVFNAPEEEKNKWAFLKAGAYLQQKDRTFSIRNIGYRSNNQFDYNLTTLPLEEILSEENINSTGGFTIDEDTKGSDQYSASNDLIAYYLMLNLPIKNFNVSGGVRIEDNTQILNSKTTQGAAIEVNKHVVSVLPSVNVSYNLTDKSLVRAAYGKTVNRPEFRELAPFSFYDFVQNFVIQGNPDLEVPVITNYDLRWEYYPNPTEFISAGLFYKDFLNPIELSLNPASTPWNVDPYNAVRSYSYGAEVDVRKSGRGITDNRWIGDLSVVANASLVKSEVTIKEGVSETENTRPRAMMFQSPYVVNAGLYFQDDTLDIAVSVLYNIIGERLFLAGINGLPDVYDMPRNIIDISLTLGSGLVTHGKYKNLKLKFGIQDLLNQQYLLLQDGNETSGLEREIDQRRQYFQRGTYYTIGLVYEFSKK